jgi:dihydrodipicolinate synthase/N-acetylneuraminate lyase
VVGVGFSGTRETVELASHAQEAGADAVLVVSPFYWKVGEEGVESVLEALGLTTVSK